MTVKNKLTRFRAYQLGNPGSSFSYFNGKHFTLIEARYNVGNKESINSELKKCGISEIYNLHITSWDQDHCVASQLEEILNIFNPKKIEYPGYTPHTDSGKDSLKIIQAYKKKNHTKKIIQVTPEYISSLDTAENYGYNDILYHPKSIDKESSNNNSTVKQFRSGSFNVLSLGDIESTQISSGLKRQKTVNSEVDVMILAHHGANNGFTTSSFLRTIKPSVAIASADYANQFKHPKPEIRNLLNKYDIPIFTTKTGDIVIYSTGKHIGQYRLVNLKAGSTEISKQCDFQAKKLNRLNQNQDTIRSSQMKRNHGPKKR